MVLMATPCQRNSTEILTQDYGLINKLLQCSRLKEIRCLFVYKGSSCKKSRANTIQPHQAETMPRGGVQTVTRPPPRREEKEGVQTAALP